DFLQTQENAKPSASQSDAHTAIGTAASDAYISTHRGLNWFTIGTTASQSKSGCYQQAHMQ
ncbi:MAG: hypothetical protein OIF47_11795, partial [Marinibacterium sp.]|nr:hypothetical protein [Marinibacterium sp.]